MAVAKILRAARDKISDPKRWIKTDYARDADGQPVSACDPRAVCWCALGAISSVAFEDRDYSKSIDALYEAAIKLGLGSGIAQINDERGHDVVLQIYDAAINGMEGRP